MANDDKKKNNGKAKKIIAITGICIIAAIVVFTIIYSSIKKKEKFIFADHLKDAVATINDEKLTYEDLSFYVLYQECTVESQARVYNQESSKDYWNLHINGEFVSVAAKNNALAMAIHDRIMYNLAMSNNVELSGEELYLLSNKQKDFWEDLFDSQKENLPTSKDFINNTIYQIALGEKYQDMLAKENKKNFFEYNYDGYEYKQMIEKDYDIEIDEKTWKKVTFGDITLTHNNVNYINGLTSEMKQFIKDNK